MSNTSDPGEKYKYYKKEYANQTINSQQHKTVIRRIFDLENYGIDVEEIDSNKII